MLKFLEYSNIVCETANAGLAAKASKSGISIGTLRTVYRRGVAAWNSGHRPGTTPQQWGMARVNSYITKGKGTYGGADKDLHEDSRLDNKAYHKGLSDSTSKARVAHWKKMDKLSDRDSRAYEPAPGDATAKTKTSKHTLKYHAMYGESMHEEILEACWVGYKQVGVKKKGNRMVPNCVAEDVDYMFHPLIEAVKAIDSGEYDYEGQMARLQLQTICRNSKDLVDMLSDDENMPEWVQSKITLAQDYISCVKDYLQSKEELGEDMNKEELEAQFDLIEDVVEQLAREHGIDSEAIWETLESVDDSKLYEYAIDAKGYKSSTGGLTQKGVDAYNAKTGGNLKIAVTTKPSKLKPGSKAANRRKSFCARMGGMKKRLTSAKTARDPDSRINKALRKWNC
jgi:hypothetical protein